MGGEGRGGEGRRGKGRSTGSVVVLEPLTRTIGGTWRVAGGAHHPARPPAGRGTGGRRTRVRVGPSGTPPAAAAAGGRVPLFFEEGMKHLGASRSNSRSSFWGFAPGRSCSV